MIKDVIQFKCTHITSNSGDKLYYYIVGFSLLLEFMYEYWIVIVGINIVKYEKIYVYQYNNE